MSSWVRIGAKCTPVNDLPWVRGRTLSLFRYLKILFLGPPTYGGVYQIMGVGSVGSGIEDGLLTVKLKGFDGWYHASAFRPVISKAYDIETFRKIASNLPTAKEMEDSVQLALERLG